MPASEGVIAARTQQAAGTQAPLPRSEARLQRILKIVVVALAILLFAGLATVIGRVIYLASPTTTQPATPAMAIRPEQSLQLPGGAKVRSISLSGSRIAVHYDVGTEPGIAVFDIETGRLITNVAVEAGTAGR